MDSAIPLTRNLTAAPSTCSPFGPGALEESLESLERLGQQSAGTEAKLCAATIALEQCKAEAEQARGELQAVRGEAEVRMLDQCSGMKAPTAAVTAASSTD